MPADPETLQAIHTLSKELRDSVEAKLDAHKRETEASRAKIYEKIDDHARDAREEQRQNTAELRGSIITLGIQVTDLASRFGSHEKADAKEIERLDKRIDAAEAREQTASDRTEGRLLAAAKILLSGGAGAAIWEALKGGGVTK